MLGLTQPVAGSVQLDGDELVGRSVKEVLRAGVGFVPEDRTIDGLVSEFSVAENLVLDLHDVPPFARSVQMNLAKVRANAEQRTVEFDVRTPSVEAAAGTCQAATSRRSCSHAR